MQTLNASLRRVFARDRDTMRVGLSCFYIRTQQFPWHSAITFGSSSKLRQKSNLDSIVRVRMSLRRYDDETFTSIGLHSFANGRQSRPATIEQSAGHDGESNRPVHHPNRSDQDQSGRLVGFVGSLRIGRTTGAQARDDRHWHWLYAG
jgi:hypothetical protein